MDTRFDDRLDTNTRLTNRQAWGVLKRALPYVYPVRHLYMLKVITMIGSVVPILLAPWPVKIIVDHVLLAHPVSGGAVSYPPFITPFMNSIEGFAPMEIMLATTALLVVIVALFGLTQIVGGPQGILTSNAILAQGDDTATRAENQASAGWSLGGGLWGYVDLKVNIRLAQTVTHLFRGHLLKRLLRLPMETLDDHRVGDAIYRVMYDTPSLPAICFNMTITPLTQLLLFGASLLIMQYSFGKSTPELVYIALAGVPIVFLIAWPFSGFARDASQNSRASGSTTTDTIEESMSNIAAVQGLGGTERERARFDSDSRESFRQFRRVVLVRTLVGITTGAAGIALLLYAWVLTSDKVISGEFTPGDYVVVLTMFITIAATLGAFARLWFDLQDSIAGARRVFFFIDMLPEDRLPEDRVPAYRAAGNGAPSPRPLPPIRNRLLIDNVDYVYPDGRQALFGVHLDARVGEVIAIVGPTGAGKTSLVYLIPAFLRPTRGRVTVDDIDLEDVDVDSLRAQVAYVFQENLLFTGTIAENIRFGKPDATDAEVENAAKLAGAHEFVEKLPNGYHTRLGRGGNTLSVGQKQRLCIARGLVREARILILDEPTSALDAETETYLVDMLRAASVDRLVIVVAHRLSTIRHADRIVFMEDGRINETGTHTELMARTGGAYRQFVELQRGDGTVRIAPGPG